MKFFTTRTFIRLTAPDGESVDVPISPDITTDEIIAAAFVRASDEELTPDDVGRDGKLFDHARRYRRAMQRLVKGAG